MTSDCERLLKGAAKAAHILLNGEEVEGAVRDVLRTLGKATDVDRVCVLKVEQGSQGKETRTRVWLAWGRGEVTAEAWEPGALLPDGTPEQWHDRLQEHAVLQGTPEDFAAPERAMLEQDGVASVLMLPVRVEEQYWGSLRLDAFQDARHWEDSEVEVLQWVARSLAQVLQRRSAAPPVAPKKAPEGLSRVDRVLIDVSRLLVSHRNFAVEELLELIGEALDAAHVYLTTVPPDDSSQGRAGGDPLKAIQQVRKHYAQPAHAGGWPSFDEYTYHEWQAPSYNGEASATGSSKRASSLAIPILSEADQLYGYLGIEYRAEQRSRLQKNRRVLNVLGDMLATYLERQLAGAALRKSEERYRAFVRTIVEGIWCIEIDPPIGTEEPLEEQLQALHQHGIVIECNESMARALGQSEPGAVIGQKASAIVPESFEGGLFRDFVGNNYKLRDREYTLHHEGKEPQHFVANVIGTVDQGRLVRIWGSWTDVTERVELERRMVNTLEQQQERIGRELHDGVGQLLTSISMLGQNMVEQYLSEREGYERAQKIVRFAQEGARLVRELQRGLAPVQAYDGGLVDALMELARNTDGLPEVTCTFEHDGETEVQEREVCRQLYRIAQEATNNALKHAAPSILRISFKSEGAQPVLQVQDDGCGFDTVRQTNQSLGLHSMRYRARSIGAVLTIDSRPGEGTTVRCVLPPESTQDHPKA